MAFQMPIFLYAWIERRKFTEKVEKLVTLEAAFTVRGASYELWGAIYSTDSRGEHFVTLFHAEEGVSTKGIYSFDDLEGKLWKKAYLLNVTIVIGKHLLNSEPKNRLWKVDGTSI